MSVGLGIVSSVEEAGALLFAGLNILVLASLLKKASATYLVTLGGDNHRDTQAFNNVKLRLQSFWLSVMVILTATVLKLVLETQLADQIIAAWFVGQGFALQPYIQSYLSGVVIRSNPKVLEKFKKPATIVMYNNTKKYKIVYQHILHVTLQEMVEGEPIVTVPWTEMQRMTFI